MKFAKILGLAAVAVLALALLGTGSASATVLCSKYKTPCPKGNGLGAGTTIEMSLEAETSLTISDFSKNLLGTCTTSTVKGTTTSAGGGEETPVEGTTETLTYGKCSATVKVLETGSFEIHYLGPETDGQLLSTGARVTIVDLGVSCTYATVGGIVLGIMQSDEIESPEFDEEATIAKAAGGFLCPGSIVVKGDYVFTAPAKIYFKKETAP